VPGMTTQYDVPRPSLSLDGAIPARYLTVFRCSLFFRDKLGSNYNTCNFTILEIIIDLPIGFPINNIISL